MSLKFARPELTNEILLQTYTRLMEKLQKRLDKHGRGCYASRHEAYGSIMEEVYEMSEAIRDDKSNAFFDELEDVAIGCMVGMASN